MSRDYTPRELLASEKVALARGGPSMWDMLKDTTIHCGATSYPLCSAEELENRRKYEYIGKLLDNFGAFYNELIQYANGIKLLERKETELKRYIEQGQGDESDYCILWFNGRLDSDFYHASRNHELFVRRMIAEAKKEDKNGV